MGRMDVNLMRYLEGEHFRVLVAVEMGMKNHELVPLPLVSAIARIHRGAVAKLTADLCKHALLAFERSQKFDGYRLTVRGYDFLSLRALCARGVVGSVGNQIGVGKESDVYIGGDPELQDLVLKFHRLGRTSFRKIKEKRDYHKKRTSASWLYLSRLAAQKEFAFLTALASRNFPVPRPVDVCRHVVVMGLVDGITLCHVDAVEDVGALYHRLMALIVKFAGHGLIHGDFNEFNLMLLKDEKVTVIDFPQMISTDHENAEFYFNRDVECIRTFFKRKFGYESEEAPTMADCPRKHSLDVELEASGFTKQMAKNLDKMYEAGETAEAISDEEEEDQEDEEEDDDDDSRQSAIEEENEDIDEEELAAAEEKTKKIGGNNRLQSWLDEAAAQLEKVVIEEGADEVPILVHPTQNLPVVDERQYESDEGKEDPPEADEPVKSRKKTTAASARGTRSVVSTGSTIAPEEIKRRVAMEMRRQKEKTKLRVKGRQSAVARGRKSNRETIGEYAGWDF